MAKFEKLTVESINVGSKGIDEKREEIITTVHTLLGFIDKELDIDQVRRRMCVWAAERIEFVNPNEQRLSVRLARNCKFSATTAPGHHAGLKRRGTIGLKVLDGFGQPFYDSEWSKDTREQLLKAYQVREVHPLLQEVIDALVALFPELPKWAMHIQDEANERMSAYPQTGWTREDLYRMPPGYRGE